MIGSARSRYLSLPPAVLIMIQVLPWLLCSAAAASRTSSSRIPGPGRSASPWSPGRARTRPTGSPRSAGPAASRRRCTAVGLSRRPALAWRRRLITRQWTSGAVQAGRGPAGDPRPGASAGAGDPGLGIPPGPRRLCGSATGVAVDRAADLRARRLVGRTARGRLHMRSVRETPRVHGRHESAHLRVAARPAGQAARPLSDRRRRTPRHSRHQAARQALHARVEEDRGALRPRPGGADKGRNGPRMARSRVGCRRFIGVICRTARATYSLAYARACPYHARNGPKCGLLVAAEVLESIEATPGLLGTAAKMTPARRQHVISTGGLSIVPPR